MTLVLHPYAGPGGASEGARLAGVDDIGIEYDPAACATRTAAGHRTIRADAASFPLGHLAGRVDGLIVTPPCQAFSTAGKGAGRDVIPDLIAAISQGDWAWSHVDDRVRHVLEVGRWAETLRPRWIVCEQVPPVLPVWQAYADRWRHTHGWSVWTGVLCAADHGVPQTRRRAFLIARTDGQPAAPPAPTHCEGGALTFDGELAPWVTMADALGWGGEDTPARTIAGNRAPRWMYPDRDGTHGRVLNPGRTATQPNRRVYSVDEPAPTVSFGHDAANWRWEGAVLDRRQQSDGVPVRLVDCDTEPAPTVTAMAGAKSQWVFHRPATTVAGDPRLSRPGRNDPDVPGSQYGPDSVRLTVRDALILQGFPADYPVQGTRTAQFRQVGDAVCPPLAAAIIRTLVS